MNNALIRLVCRILVVCMGALPFGSHAGMVGTDQIVAAAQAAAARDKLRNFVERREVREQLQNLGVSAAAATARVNAMSDAEIASVAGRIDALPAGGISTWAVLATFIVFELIWYFWVK